VTRRRILAALLTAVLAGCAHARNHPDEGPRFAGSYRLADTDPAFRVASFNVKFSRHPDRVVALFREHAPLAGADVVALQEMREDGVELIARELGYDYVYYPSTVHPSAKGNFGNAVLSRWPIVEDRKLPLPHLSRWRKVQRAACVAVVQTGTRRLRVYSVHLETPFGISRKQREDQARTIIEDAQSHAEPAVVAGDFNSRWIGDLFERAGFRWPTKKLGKTLRWFSWDHVFVKGLPVPEKPAGGIVRDTKGASDHRPVWVEVPIAALAGGTSDGGQLAGSQPLNSGRPASAARAAQSTSARMKAPRIKVGPAVQLERSSVSG
jgi:endonuclease/exonuclease/phosphatase family metal-dependent hydrolase